MLLSYLSNLSPCLYFCLNSATQFLTLSLSLTLHELKESRVSTQVVTNYWVYGVFLQSLKDKQGIVTVRGANHWTQTCHCGIWGEFLNRLLIKAFHLKHSKNPDDFSKSLAL